jgi:curved DNA-binding protein CbpA
MKRFLSSHSKHVSFYQLLHVHPEASTAEIKAQYFKLCKQTHPDTNSHASAQFIQLTEAYNTLKDSKLRREYDRHWAATVEYKTPQPPQPVPFAKESSSQQFWAVQRNQEKVEEEAEARQAEDKLDLAVKRSRWLVVGAITFGYILTCFR